MPKLDCCGTIWEVLGMARRFESETDRPLLREAIRRLCDEGLLTHGRLAKALKGHEMLGGPKNPISKTSIDRFILEDDDLPRSIPQLGQLWNYLASHPIYQKYMPEDAVIGATVGVVDRNDANDLSWALGRFFDHDGRARNLTKIDSISSQIVGSYMMYRPDIRPVVEPLRPNGLVRASRFDIFDADGSLYCRENQSTTRDKYGSANPQKNFGPLFAYQDRVFFLMRGEINHSLKFGVIEMMRDWNDGPWDWFRGSILVVSNFGTFPLVKFFCLRNDEKYSDGILELSELPDEEVTAFIKKSIDELNQMRN
jgi:hypothetical protein